MIVDTDTFLAQQRAELLRELVDADDKARRRDLVDKLQENLSVEAYRAENSKARYARYKKAREAMQAFFAAEGRPRPEDAIKLAICDHGGFRRGSGGIAGARLVIQKSIKLHLHGSGAKKWPLKQINGLIGPKDWDDHLFEEPYSHNP